MPADERPVPAPQVGTHPAVYVFEPAFDWQGSVGHLIDEAQWPYDDGAVMLCGRPVPDDAEVGDETLSGVLAGCDGCRKAFGLGPWSPYS